MQMYSVSATENALIIFVDIIDSSQYSAVLDPTAYALQLLYYQNLFERLAKQYFGDCVKLPDKYTHWVARGDEGLVFSINQDKSPSEQIYRAIEFVFELKAHLRIYPESSRGQDKPPRPIGVGAGIHLGPVATITSIMDGRSVIDRLEGYSINFAKRVESCSRIGHYSHIFLSSQAQKLLEGYPVILLKREAPMKGITNQGEVYEVRAGYFGDISLEWPGEEEETEYLAERICYYAEHADEIDEPWLKSIVISVLNYLEKNACDDLKVKYRERRTKVVWNSPSEDDPILLYIRAKDCHEKKWYTHELRYLELILKEFSTFVHARIDTIKACQAILTSNAERAEKVYARDMAREFLEHFPDFLTDLEKKDFKKLLRK